MDFKKYKEKLLERFIDYVKWDTQSDENSVSIPSSAKQMLFARELAKELNEMGLQEVELTEKGYIYATLPANGEGKVPAVGFIAHMDTSPDMSGKDVRPRILKDYPGEDILLHKEHDVWLKTEEFPFLKNYIGKTIITTDGNTLLGGDNKAGIAEIITSVEFLMEHPEIKHGDIKIAFTPDEEIGRGADHFDVNHFNASFAYTIDGGEIGELEYENFNAALAKISFKGKNVHPGTAKNIMINASLLAMQFDDMLPHQQRPEYTKDYEGFYHLIRMEGTVENATLQYILRDHDRKKFEAMKLELKRIATFINERFGKGSVYIEVKDQYYNMKEKIEPVFYIVELAKKAYRQAGVNPNIVPVRGGTDGARLSYMGLPTPNIFTGGHNFHGRYECIVLESMIKAMEVIVNICTINYADKQGF